MTIPFTVEASRAGRTARLVLAGELDASVAQLETMFRGVRAVHGVSSVVIDVRGLELCDSAGWHSLEHCRNEGATLLGDPACLRRHLIASELDSTQAA